MSWKREEIPDHKFDYVDVDAFVDHSLIREILYLSVFIYALKDILVYMADLGSVILLVASNYEIIFNNGDKEKIIFGPGASFEDAAITNGTATKATATASNAIIEVIGGNMVLFFIIIASLIASFVLLMLEWRKANRIIKSKDISYAFTSEVAYSYYTIRSYPHYCFFSQIQNSRKSVDILAFWVFFKFRGWKRLLLAEFPRQFLNSILVYDIFSSRKENSFIDKIEAVYESQTDRLETLIFLGLQLVTISIWVISFLGLVVAFLIYIPLLCNIRGNLKEYCVHKIDKRIEEILKRKTRKRIQEARREEEEQGLNTLSTRGGKDQPTLPNIDIDLDDQSVVAPSTYSHAQYYYGNGYNEYQDYEPSEVGSSVSYSSSYYNNYNQQDATPPSSYGTPLSSSRYAASNPYIYQDRSKRHSVQQPVRK